ncbi:MAG: sensor histidine kinase [Acidimicrobiales bacterium]
MRPRALRIGSWPEKVVVGFYRSLLLVGLTLPIPAVVGALGYLGARFVLSWTADAQLPQGLLVLLNVAELALAAWWVLVAFAGSSALVGRSLSEATRRCLREWLGLRIEPRYRPLPPVTRMASGQWWWNGFGYHSSEREARRDAWMRSRHLLGTGRDAQVRRDALWMVVAGVTALPVAALPLAAVVGGAYAAGAAGLLGWGVGLALAGVAGAPFAWRILAAVGPRFLGPAPRSRQDQRIEELESIRVDMTHAQAAELERIERDLHDGTQARMVALGMSLGAAEVLVDTDPDAAKAILAEARASSATALAELRSLVRGVNPPVLAERGLVDALRALALDASVPVVVRSGLGGRPERPVESAVYFAVSELVANVAKHARATRSSVDLDYQGGTLTAVVSDDGVGGAEVSGGSGLAGVRRRMAAFGGRVEIDSPTGGPTRVGVTVPCELS